jgi:hypothetical protein
MGAFGREAATWTMGILWVEGVWHQSYSDPIDNFMFSISFIFAHTLQILRIL